LTKRQREQLRIDQAYRRPLLWLLLGVSILLVLLYPVALKIAHYWDLAEMQPLVVDHH
jgi:hypothetical protein